MTIRAIIRGSVENHKTYQVSTMPLERLLILPGDIGSAATLRFVQYERRMPVPHRWTSITRFGHCQSFLEGSERLKYKFSQSATMRYNGMIKIAGEQLQIDSNQL